MKKFLLSITTTAVLSLGSAAASAAFLPVTIDETQLAGVGTHIAPNVGKLNGFYQEVLTVNADSTFAASTFATFTAANTPTGGFVSTGLGSQYNLYAVFNSTGVVKTPTSFTGLLGTFDVYIDRNTDSVGTFGATGATSVAVSNTGDDTKIASSSHIQFAQGDGVGSPSTSFIFLFDDFALTADGAKYFTSPIPFYMLVNVNGDFDGGLNATSPGTYGSNANPITGDVSANFDRLQVPEPGSLALLGIGLAGLGLTQRRRKLAFK